MAQPTEVELKLAFDPAAAARLADSPPLALGSAKPRHLVATYFDTPDHALVDAGYALRIRRSGRARVQTIKAEGQAVAALFVRPEWERAVPGDRPVIDEASGPLLGMLGEEKLATLGPVFVTDIRRASGEIDFGGARIEVALDRGEIRAMGHVARIAELELELAGGSPAALFRLARALDAAVPLRLAVRSKAERGYALAAGEETGAVGAEPVRLPPDADAGAAFAAIAANCIRQFRLNEDLLMRTGDADALHQARVGLRRLRSAFALFGAWLEEDRDAARLKPELRWLAGTLGEARNIDVLLPRVKDGSRGALAAARDRAFADACDALGSARARGLMLDLAEWLALEGWRSGFPSAPATALAADILDRRRKRVKRRGRRLADFDDEKLHALRIEAKKLRYASEFFGSLWPGKTAARRRKPFVAALKALQDSLGLINDDAVAGPLLARLGVDARHAAMGQRKRARLLEKAVEAYDELVDAKRFWRA